nr:unnamed protein product [Callosobruchus chinensis]
MPVGVRGIFLLLFIAEVTSEKRCPSQEAILPCRCLVKKEEYQIWCSHSDLPRVLDSLRSLTKYIKDPIDELILENNYLPSLPGRTFASLKVLRLMLRHNALERLSADWLAGLEDTLMEVFVVEPQLRSIPDESLSKLVSLQAATIQSKLLKRCPRFSDLPKLRYIQIESQLLLELSPMNFKNNPSLEKIHISSCPALTRLEANTFSDLPKLDLINITNSGINWIHPRAFTALPELKELRFVGTKFIDAGIVGRGSKDLPQLESIVLDSNQIDRVGEAAFVDLPSLRKVSLENNRIMELHHGAFHRVPELKTLNLNNNMVKRIHPESFLQQSGSGLEELFLVGNDISHVAELRSLLDALPRLTFLDLSYNNLESIPGGALRGHATLEHLNLNYNKLRSIGKEAFMAMPALRELRLKNNSLTDIFPGPFWNLPALKGLDLSENFLRKLEPTFLENLPSLRRLDLSGNELTMIEQTAFLPTPSLEHINVSYNHLKVIHPATFRHLLHLYELDVSRNELLEFVPGLPRGIEHLHLHHNEIQLIPHLHTPDLDLPALKSLDLSSNRIENIGIGTFKTLPHLKRLYLGENLLKKIEEHVLEGITHLEVLDLRENRLVDIHPNAFMSLPELKQVVLRKNHLDLLVPDLFKFSSKLRRVDISGNSLPELLPGTLENNLEIESVDASENVLVQLPKTFQNLKTLKKLDLTHNRIKHIDPNILSTLTSLKSLKISRNFIQEVREGTFHNLAHLKTLHLDNNEVEIIESNAIRALPVLKSIKLNKNKIKEIPNLAFNKLPSLQTVELQENLIRSIAPKAFNLVPQMIMVNLSNNQIFDVEEIGLKSMISLEVLDLSNNRITRLSNGVLEKMEWMVELKMDNNEICGVKGPVFNGMPRLRVLSLRNNKLITFPEKAVQRLRSNIAVLDLDGNPLSCACPMLWLQAWLQETPHQRGPKCADGSLLRGMRISRHDCSEEQRNAEIYAPGCETESLTGVGYGNTQTSAKWVVKNSSSVEKNQLAPTPEESEYFYDDYVDYPINESMIEQNGLTGNGKFREPLTTQVNSISPHTTGGTATIYAATKNRTKKPEIPTKVTNSPSSSGFTFFGIPLNTLLGGNFIQKQSSSIPKAERKTAVVNRGNERVTMGNIQSHLPYMKATINKILPPAMQPPSAPHLEGGFKPILPGDGGFKPIPNPMTEPPANVTIQKVSQRASHVVAIENKFNSSLPQNKSSNNVSSTPSTQASLVTSSSRADKGLDHFNVSRKSLVEEKQHLKSELNVLSESIQSSYMKNASSAPNKAPSNLVATQTATADIETAADIAKLQTQTITTPNVTPKTSTSTTTTVSTTQVNGVPKIEKVASVTPTLLAPIAPPPQMSRNGGKPTITKIASPTLSASPATSVQSSSAFLQAESSDFFVPDPMAHREPKKTLINSRSFNAKSDNDWYFANYNKTNLEPFVSKIINVSECARVDVGFICIVFNLILINLF